ncbi:uncharacterized protein [Coffea arabica]|uniref:Uncharacterized protein isoform X1 n=1 Tax=Coffea arabica TaxID=13443 RepID=A0ABM4U1U1_COFAR|nr:E3 ubiquitin-protein ligase MARCH1-like isoform X1 [Coffea arabica]
MQLVSNDSRAEDILETEPILSQSATAKRSEESSSSIEITVSGEFSLTVDDSPSGDADENCSLVHADQPLCRICLDTGGEDLIAPCHCKGTQKHVHRSCLDNWRSTKEGFAFSHCTECRAVFILRANVPPDRWWLRLKFQFLVARDHAFIFVIVQLFLGVYLRYLIMDFQHAYIETLQIVAFLGVLVYKFYGEELREMFGYEEHPYGFYTMAVLAVVLVGLLYGFFIAIICGQRINERHYHVLAKQELTKEYIVEDRESSKDVPDLDPSHITELRMLGLY